MEQEITGLSIAGAYSMVRAFSKKNRQTGKLGADLFLRFLSLGIPTKPEVVIVHFIFQKKVKE